MSGRRLSRRCRGAFSALYGAFGVILAALVVAGLVGQAFTAMEEPSKATKRTADRFLKVLLDSSLADGNGTLREAVGRLCMASPCSTQGATAASVAENASALSGPLARALEVQVTFTVVGPEGEVLRAGAPAVARGAGLAQADVYHAPSAGFLTVLLALEDA